MTKNTYAIMGATGRIGHVITEELLRQGHIVRAIGRDQSKLQRLKDKGAMTYAISFDDASSLAEVFRGSQAVFSFLPPSYSADDYDSYINKVGEAIKNALINESISHVVNLSSMGANQTDGTGPIKFLNKHETRLNDIPGINLLHFRPGYFMENLYWSIPIIKETNKNGSGLRPDMPIAFVHTRDVGEKIAALLGELKFKEKTVFEFVGPGAFTMMQVTALIGNAINKSDLQYVQLSDSEINKALQSLGLKPKLIQLMIEMYAGINEGKARPTQPLTPPHIGKISLESFSKTFLQMYNSNLPLLSP